MARELNGTSDHITFTVSTPLQTLVAGSTTIVAIINVLDTTDGAIVHFRTSGGAIGTWMEISGGAWNYGQNVTAKALVAPNIADGWAMYAGHKTTGGANAPTGRKVLMPSGTTSQVTAGTGLVDGTAPGVGGIFEVGKWGTAAEFLHAQLAALAIFNIDITTTSVLDGFATSYTNLLAGTGAASPPIWCVHFDQASPTDPITDDTGNGGNSLVITGTTIVANPTGYFGAAPAAATPQPLVAPAPAAIRASTW